MLIRTLILERITEIAEQQHRTLATLADDLPLLESGLDSLCVGILIASLDESLGIDPFADDDEGFPVTLGDFITCYEHGAA